MMMLFDLLGRFDLRLTCLREYTGSKLVNDEKTGKPKWVPQRLKEVRAVSWNITDVDKVLQVWAEVEDGTWDDLFEKIKRVIYEKTTKRGEVC